MTHQEYIKAIQKQQSLISSLFNCRKERSKKIDQIVMERYGSLIGKFFKADDRMPRAHSGAYYHIVGLSTNSNYLMSTQVDIRLICRYLSVSQTISYDTEMMVTGAEFITQEFPFTPSDDILALIEPMLVSKEEAIGYCEDAFKQVMENFLRIN